MSQMAAVTAQIAALSVVLPPAQNTRAYAPRNQFYVLPIQQVAVPIQQPFSATGAYLAGWGGQRGGCGHNQGGRRGGPSRMPFVDAMQGAGAAPMMTKMMPRGGGIAQPPGVKSFGLANKCKHLVSACKPASDPTPINSTSSKDDDDVTIITSNRLTNVSLPECVREHSKVRHGSQSPVEIAQNVPVHFGSKVRHVSQSPVELLRQQPHFPRKRLTSSQVRPSIAMAACTFFGSPMPQYLKALTIATNQAIANMGATSIFIMEGADVNNKHLATVPLTINFPDGKRVQSTHVCDIWIPGLPTVLTGHIVPPLRITSLIGIRPLCKAECKVIFDNKKCDLVFDGVVILRGFKDPSTDFWTLPIPTKVCTAPGPTVLPRPGPCKSHAPHLPMDTSDTHTGVTQLSRTLYKLGLITSSLYTNPFAAPRSQLSSRPSTKGSSKGAPIYWRY
jgi:hypothetical protein